MPWQPLYRTREANPKSREERIQLCIAAGKELGREVPRESAEALVDRDEGCEMWANDRYCVHVDRQYAEGWVHISIKTHDKAPVRDWRDFQKIKNDILGPECEAVELYPAESRCIDTVNQYHLWGNSDPEFRFPLGFDCGRAVSSTSGTHNTRQRPLEED